MIFDSQIIKKKVEQRMADFRAIRNSISLRKKEINKFKLDVLHTTQAREIAQDVSKKIQQAVHKQINDVVSRCLESVFNEPYEFKIEFVSKRGKTEAVLKLLRGGLELENPMDEAGGGVIDVASFALRTACLLLAKSPTLRKVLILDEPFKFVSEEYLPKVRELIEQLSADLGIQFIFVTHIDKLKTGHIIKVGE